MNYDYNDSKYTKIISKNRNYINNTPENNNIYNKENFISNNFYSNSMIEPKSNQNLFNTQNYQLLSSYPNNLNYKYKNDTPFNPKNKEQNSIQNDYKYIPNNEINNNPKNLFPNILASPNDKNISLTSQISQEIDRQKLKFDEMVEKAKNINNSELFEFDLKKYLPKDNFENSKTFRKYKDLIKPNINSNRNNFFNKKNEVFKYNDIKDNSLSEIPIRNDNLFEDELSNFNLDNKEINIIDYNNENEKENNNLERNNQEQLKQNLLNNVDNYNSNDRNKNIDNNKNNSKDDNNIINQQENHNKEKLNQVINCSHNNSGNEFDNKNKSNNIKSPYYCIYYEKINIDNDEENIKDEENEEFNEIEKLNMRLNRENNNLKNINEFGWHCLDFSEEKPNNIFNEFFNDDEI